MKRVLITGATGFIGCRLAEVACSRAISVVGLVREWSHAARLGRLPVRMVSGDILDPDSLREAMTDCDVVFHCAVDKRMVGKAHQLSSAQGTVNVLQTALEIGVKRVVHLSSAAVHSYKPTPDAATEEGAYRYSGDFYCDGKIDGEKAALRFWHDYGLPVTVLRPTIVYGPFGYHTVQTATFVREGRMVLLNAGTGICNSLYVDNLVEAMLLVAEHQGALGQVFHISDAKPISWKEFIEAHARALGDSYLPLRAMSLPEMEEVWAQAARQRRDSSSWKQVWKLLGDPKMREALSTIPVVRRSVAVGKFLARTVVPPPTRQVLRQRLFNTTMREPPRIPPPVASVPVLSKAELGMFTTFDELAFSINKARRVLGFEPRVSFDEGMRRTAAWIQWAKL